MLLALFKPFPLSSLVGSDVTLPENDVMLRARQAGLDRESFQSFLFVCFFALPSLSWIAARSQVNSLCSLSVCKR